MLVDLHLHSCFSDGTHTPAQAARLAAQQGLGLIALADHNTCAGWRELRNACRQEGLLCLRGMEVDCLYPPYEIHILAYGFRPEGRIMELAGRSRQLLLDMSDDLVDRLIPRYPQLSRAEYDAYRYDPTLGGWKGLHYLHAKGVIPAPEDGMRLYGRYGCDYRDYPFPAAAEVCSAIREAGGVPVLAHPCNWFDAEQPDALARHLDALREMGIGGIECHYPANSSAMTRLCKEYCRRHGLLITAGSDSHGAFGKNHHGISYYIGAVQVPLEELELGPLLECVQGAEKNNS